MSQLRQSSVHDRRHGALSPGAITPDAIRERTFDLWERHHRPEGFELQFWFMAERELRAEIEVSSRSGAPPVERANAHASVSMEPAALS